MLIDYRIRFGALAEGYPLTRDDVVVAMRFGDRLSSLFHHPMQAVEQRRWRPVDTIRRPEQVFDIALYVKRGDR